jgi:hypothetical protein
MELDESPRKQALERNKTQYIGKGVETQRLARTPHNIKVPPADETRIPATPS